jgi:hypothetical protein
VEADKRKKVVNTHNEAAECKTNIKCEGKEKEITAERWNDYLNRFPIINFEREKIQNKRVAFITMHLFFLREREREREKVTFSVVCIKASIGEKVITETFVANYLKGLNSDHSYKIVAH